MIEIITGRAKGRRLEGVEGKSVRPSSSRCRSGIFSKLRGLLGGDFSDERVLDGFAGVGSLGLEAWSEGCDDVVFMEQDRKVLSMLQKNVQLIGANSGCRLYLGRSPEDWSRIVGDFTLIFLDPPYASGLAVECLEIIKGRKMLRQGGLVVIEYDLKGGFEAGEGWEIVSSGKYGIAGVVILQESLGL